MGFGQRSVHHTAFEREIVEFLEERGFLCGRMAYHEVLEERIRGLLAQRDTPTSERVRMWPDILAVHTQVELEFLVEAKTHGSSTAHNLAIEARMLAQRVEEAERGVRCLLAYRDSHPQHQHDVGFWIREMPPVDRVRIPTRWRGETRARYEATFGDLWPHAEIDEFRGRTHRGSDTPFAIIEEAHLEQLGHWRSVVDAALAEIGYEVGTERGD